MTLVDLSILLAAVNSRAPQHKQAHAWWEARLNSNEPTALTWLVVLGFLRLTTHPKLLPEPLLLGDAIAMVDGWLARPNVQMLQVTGGHWNILQTMLLAVGHGSTLTMDAHLACLAIQHGCEIATLDEDFSHFPGVNWYNPTKPRPTEE
jgi:uncharacterized protein